MGPGLIEFERTPRPANWTASDRVSARTAPFDGKPERQLELHDRMRFEIRDGDRQQRNHLLVRVISKGAAHQVLGDLSERPRCRNRR